MRFENPLSAVSRRDFLRLAGLATGATVSLPLQAYARLIFDGRPPLRVGMVVPRSKIHSEIGANLVEGMRLQFREAGWESTRLVVREVASGEEIAAARRLLSEEKVEILTGMFNPRTVHLLREDLERSGTLCVAIEGGANTFVPREESPLMYQNSLGYWQSNWAMGSWAARNVGQRAAVVTAFYETGYDSCQAFPQGFEAGGGTIIRSDVTHAPLGGTDPVSAMKAIAAARPDVLFLSASGKDARDLFAAYRDAGLKGKIPLAVSGFMAHELLPAGMGPAAEGIMSCLPWAPALDSAENHAFCSSFARTCGRQPDSFAVLGYDTGGMIVGTVAAAAGRVQKSSDLKRALEELQVPSPRGALRFTAASGGIDAPLYLCEVRTRGTSCRNEVISRVSSLQEVEKSAHRPALVARSGWTNGYLCV